MEFVAGPQLVNGSNKTFGAEGFENYAKSSLRWQQPPPKSSDGGDPANPLWVFWSPEDTGRFPAITDALQRIRVKEDRGVLVQLWCPVQQAGSGWLLRTSNQPFGLTELNDDLCSYRMASLKHEFYVDWTSDVGIGFVGRVFLKRSAEWTPNVQNYSRKEYPQIDEAVRCNIRGSLAIPVFSGQFCLGVLEIVMTIEKESFDCEFREICIALQCVNLQSSELLFCPTKKLITRKSKPIVKSDVVVRPKRKTKTKTSEITYEDLSRHFGKPRLIAAAELNISKSTFRNKCRELKIDKWPYKKRTRGCCKLGKYNNVTLEQTTEVLEPTSFAVLDDIVTEESSTLTREDESGAVSMDDQFPKEVFETTFLAETDATATEDLGNIITMDECISDDQPDQEFWEGLGDILPGLFA